MEQVQQTETQIELKHGIYFANLEAYNRGNMIGGWVWPLHHDSIDSFYKAIKRVTRNADEVAVHDYDDFIDMGEYPSHESLYNLAHAVNDYNVDMELIKKYVDHNYYNYDFNNIDDLLSEMQDKFQGFADNFQEFAEMYIEETNLEFQEMSSYLKTYFDYESYSKDLKHDFTIIELSNYTVAIYSNY